MEISIERSPQHWCPSAGFELTTVGSEFDTLDRSATDPQSNNPQSQIYIISKTQPYYLEYMSEN